MTVSCKLNSVSCLGQDIHWRDPEMENDLKLRLFCYSYRSWKKSTQLGKALAGETLTSHTLLTFLTSHIWIVPRQPQSNYHWRMLVNWRQLTGNKQTALCALKKGRSVLQLPILGDLCLGKLHSQKHF